MDIKDVTMKTLSVMNDTGQIDSIVEKVLTKTITEIVEQSMNRWSDFGKVLEASVKERLRFNPEELTLGRFNELITKQIVSKIEERLGQESCKIAEQACKELFATRLCIKPVYHLHEFLENLLVKDAINQKTKNVSGDMGEGFIMECTLHISPKVKEGYGRHLYFSQEECLEKYSCNHIIFISEDGAIEAVRARIGGGYDSKDPDTFLIMCKQSGVKLDITDIDSHGSRSAIELDVTEIVKETDPCCCH